MTPIKNLNLKDKVAVITGGGGIICSVMAKALAAKGVKTAILDLKKESAENVANEIKSTYGTESIGIAANVLDKSNLESAKQIINNNLGSIDFLINGAGGNAPSATSKAERIEPENLDQLEDTFFGLQLEGFEKTFDLNFKGTLLPTLVFAKDMVQKQKGGIVNISSMNSYRPLTKIPAYSASKAAINNFTQWLAVHFAKIGVRVNAIAPGFLLTNQNRFLLIDEKTGEATARGEKIINGTPMERYGTPEELTGTLIFLLSDWSEFITGVVIPVDGGFSAYSGV
ncbi:SDR family oxidoreductase [Thermophagus xiamenensis]|uniref:NAD(P)-dependent dehydrogenase, short-chain alcohol dehydrogenase family n=1 Tax=Thermophagus xiamenensis TaxID=385682 RepID=A0A1I2BES9_9BACT|nr:SDR family oxidoreductase [Thermophagus xiamenensis]SFE54388.1 NAD(P)-dependent dehydrogenase, short-chain alcohol dehydrogenase family [Thermophagus xiamenensis]